MTVTAAQTATRTRPRFADATAVLADKLPGYRSRTGQTAMAEAVEALIADWADARTDDEDDEDGPMPPALMVNAPCGTGKSLAFLIPAAQSGMRVVVATATIALQTQLIDKDLPFLAEHMPDFPSYAILKGRSNYVCLAKLDEDPQIEGLAALKAELAADGATGDRESLTMQISAEDWRAVSATSDECPGASECPLFGEICFTEKAKAVAADARIVITNDAYLGSDMAMREATDGYVSLLGEVDLLIVDEADALDNALRSSLTKQLTLRGLLNLAASAQHLARACGKAEDRGEDLGESVALIQAAHGLGAVLPKIADPDKPAEPPAGTKLLLTWFAGHVDQIKDLVAALQQLSARIRRIEADGPKETVRKKLLKAQADNACAALKAALRAEDDQMVRFNSWTTYSKAAELFWTIEFCPVDISGLCRDQLWSRQATVLTSATLTTAKGDFGYFVRTTGLEHATALDVESPFDFATQALLFTPGPGVPAPGEYNAWVAYVATATQAMVSAAGGGALLLYTSRKAMTDVHQLIAPRLRAAGLTVLIQDGKTSNAELARIFREDENSVLFGVKSFFVGLDVPGNALRLVVMDKLPFAVPTDYVYEARALAEEKAGRRPFYSLSVPMMTLDLTQGFGRLIRRDTDRGVVAILDSRLATKYDAYGRQIITGLPDCPATVDLADVAAFFQAA